MEYLYYHQRMYLRMTKKDSERKKNYAKNRTGPFSKDAGNIVVGGYHTGEKKGTWHLFRHPHDPNIIIKRKVGPNIRSPITLREDYILDDTSGKYKRKSNKELTTSELKTVKDLKQTFGKEKKKKHSHPKASKKKK